ncbi:MAG: hypothetical protein HeimC2_08640 [Candidatus Heimdallarchaeota archaeon LC_2]|nr:MAG: hypothetical protein HeimC2_08640 [Candidatus Heimdallarchaeota archaeon LC_2]
MKRELSFIILLSFVIFSQNPIYVSADDIDVPYAYLYYSDFSGIAQDGVVGENEYPSFLEVNNIGGEFVSRIWWAHNDTYVAVAIMINGTGWIGLGLGELGTTMVGGNIIMASYDPVGDIVTINDMFANGQTDPVIDTDSISFDSTGGSEVNGETIIEFMIPMALDDPAGHDQFWHVGDRFGFFTAFRRTGKDFDREHHEHSGSETVEIVDKIIGSPVDSDFTFNVINNNDGTVTLHSQFNAGAQSDDHEVGYFQKSIFGLVKLQDIFTDNTGAADLEVEVEKTGELEFVSIFFGDINHTRKELTFILDIEEVVVVEESTYGDLRDTLGPHFMRNFLVFALFFFVSWLIYLYSSVVFDLFKINKIGREENSKKKEVSKE